MKTKTRAPLCYCSRCNDKTPHWYDRVFYAFFCTVCNDSPRNAAKEQVQP